MLQARDIRVSIGRKEILRGVTLTAAAGQVTAIVGPNGSGKSTLLKAITGDIPATGHVEINGQDAAAMAAHELAAIRAVLPQASSLAFPFLAEEVVRIGQRGGIHAADESLPERALNRVGLPGYGPRFYQELSGGEQQRVQLARVLSQVWDPVVGGEPAWLFLDEPVSSLDIAHQLSVMEIAKSYARGGGGVVVVMHDLNLTAMSADTVAVMKDGRILATGAPQTVFTDAVLSEAYNCSVRVNTPAPAGQVFLLPQAASTSSQDLAS